MFMNTLNSNKTLYISQMANDRLITGKIRVHHTMKIYAVICSYGAREVPPSLRVYWKLLVAEAGVCPFLQWYSL